MPSVCIKNLKETEKQLLLLREQVKNLHNVLWDVELFQIIKQLDKELDRLYQQQQQQQQGG